MTTPRTRLSLHYRPSADVLSGEVDLGHLGVTETVAETPDADSSVVWHRAATGEHTGEEFLGSFHVVHALARWQADALAPLPCGVAPIARQLMASATTSLGHEASALARLRAKVDTMAELPLDALRRPPTAPPPPPLPAASSARAPAPAAAPVRAGPVDRDTVTAALHRLASALTALTALTARTADLDHHRALHADHLCRLLRELASTLAHGEGRPAPGTAAAARAAVRAGAPVGAHERETLRRALTDIDDPAQWGAVRRTLDAITAALEP